MVLAFFLCWAPFHAQRLGYVYFKESKIFRTLNEYLYYGSGFFYYLSATVNPILYNLMSLKYRHAFRQTLCSRKRRSRSAGNSNRTRQGGIHKPYGHCPGGLDWYLIGKKWFKNDLKWPEIGFLKNKISWNYLLYGKSWYKHKIYNLGSE